jgi:glycosyltransferase involved in cell wall biosynthesis
MLRIVITLSDPPLPFGNAAARWYHVLIRGLSQRGHRVTTFAVCDDRGQAAQVTGLFPKPQFDVRLYEPPLRQGLGAKLESWRRPYSYSFGPDLRRDLDAELAKGVDVLHLEQTWCGWLGLAHTDRALVNVHSLYQIDLSARPPSSLYDRFRRRAVFRAERSLLRSFPSITTLTPRLTREVRRIGPLAAVHTVPLGIDLSLYPFEASVSTRPPVVGLIGSFNWEPTYSAGIRLVTRLWPAIRRRVADARLQIVGRYARSALGHLAGSPGIELFEDVPDVIPYFRGVDVMLYAPGPASGMKVKVMEAFALGTLVVTNVDGCEGLPVVDGVHAGIAEDDEGLVERVVALLSDPERCNRQRRSARALLEAHCSPQPVLDRLEQVYATLPHSSTRGRPSQGRVSSRTAEHPH